jgi:hypothetical protein
MTTAIKRVRDLVMSMFPLARVVLLPHEEALALYLRGNTPLHESLSTFIQSRINGRAMQPPPTDPLDCRAILERDYELRWLLNRLDLVYRSPAANEGELPA